MPLNLCRAPNFQVSLPKHYLDMFNIKLRWIALHANDFYWIELKFYQQGATHRSIFLSSSKVLLKQKKPPPNLLFWTLTKLDVLAMWWYWLQHSDTSDKVIPWPLACLHQSIWSGTNFILANPILEFCNFSLLPTRNDCLGVSISN